jgi:hypothetical protein
MFFKGVDRTVKLFQLFGLAADPANLFFLDLFLVLLEAAGRILVTILRCLLHRSLLQLGYYTILGSRFAGN